MDGECYFLFAQDGYCHVDEAVCGVQISNYSNTPQGNVSALVSAVYERGPISVAIDASHLSFAFYSHGVYYEPKCGKLLFYFYQRRLRACGVCTLPLLAPSLDTPPYLDFPYLGKCE